MVSSWLPSALQVPEVKAQLRRLRLRESLAHPATVLQLSAPLRAHLTNGQDQDPSAQVVSIMSALRCAIDALGDEERLSALVGFNLLPGHSHPTLSERQESLARHKRCAAKTVRRHAERALDTLALLLVTGTPASLTTTANSAATLTTPRAAHQTPDSGPPGGLWRFWGLSPASRVDIVCSEIPPDERPHFASPSDRNYLRYAKFADLDTLIDVRTRMAQLAPGASVRDFSASEYFDTAADLLIVIGGPPWNTKYREFLLVLPYSFEQHPLGEDDPLVLPGLHGGLRWGPRWSKDGELLEDLAVFTRLTLGQGTTVILLGGCLTLGVLGAARCFLAGERGARNAAWVTDLVGTADVVVVTEARRVGGITDTPDLTSTEPLLLLSRHHNEPFTPVVDNSGRYPANLRSTP